MNSTISTRHIYIYAGSHRQAMNFAREKELHPQNWTFLSKPEQLRGIRGSYFIRCGTWFERPNCREIEDMLLEREMKKKISNVKRKA